MKNLKNENAIQNSGLQQLIRFQYVVFFQPHHDEAAERKIGDRFKSVRPSSGPLQDSLCVVSLLKESDRKVNVVLPPSVFPGWLVPCVGMKTFGFCKRTLLNHKAWMRLIGTSATRCSFQAMGCFFSF